MEVAFRLSGLPAHEVAWMDTRSGVPMVAALPEVSAENDLHTVTVPSGTTRQVWLTC